MPYISHYRSGTSPAGADVVLLLHYDGNFTDSSQSAHTVTANGSIGRTSSTVKFGSEAVTFDGIDDYLSVADSTDWPVGSLIWSVDFWLYVPTSASLATDNTLVSQWQDSADQRSWWIGLNEDCRLRFFRSSNGTLTNAHFHSFSATGDITRDAWHHIAVWRSPITDEIQGAVNGVRTYTTEFVPAGQTLHDSTANLTHGATGDALALLPSGIVIDELRICKGAIDYADADFTPPTAAYP